MTSYANLVEETTTTTGVGDTILLGGATSGHAAFGDNLADTETCYFKIENPDGNWQIYLGAYSSSGNSLDRSAGWIDTLIFPSPAMNIEIGAKVSLVVPAVFFATAELDIANLKSGQLGDITDTLGGNQYYTAHSRIAQTRLTTSATPAQIYLGHPNGDGILQFRGLVSAYQRGGVAGTVGDSASWEVSGTLAKVGTAFHGPTSIVQTHVDAAAAAWTLAAVSPDNIALGRVLECTGEANKDIVWASQIYALKMRTL